jgi:K+-sensing histidine kinase KdpD
LLAERAQLVWVVEQSNDGYLLVSSQDEVLYANPKARLYLGFAGAPGEFITEKFRVQAQKQYRCEPVEAWADWPAQSNTSLQTSRYLVRPESATARACWLQVALLDRPAGLENYRLIQLRDVTAQMNLQRDVRTFHNMLSHKLRTPLTFITASLETMSEEQPPLSVEEMIDLSKMALKGAHRLREEIEDILRYLNISKLTQRDTRCLLSEIPQIVTKIRNDLRLPSVRVFGQVDVEDVQLILSRRAVESILWEILENAQKFHPLQSPLVGVTITPCLEESAVNLKIADDGLTLSPEQLSQAWLPYYQGEKYFTGQATGMGLGLPTVASLIWEAGGSCSLYNRAEGAGVVVELNIPLAQP